MKHRLRIVNENYSEKKEPSRKLENICVALIMTSMFTFFGWMGYNIFKHHQEENRIAEINRTQGCYYHEIDSTYDYHQKVFNNLKNAMNKKEILELKKACSAI